MLVKTWFLLLYLFSNVKLDFNLFTWFHNTKQSPEIPNLKVEMLFKFQNYWVLINGSCICFGFALDLPDTDLNLFKTNIDSFPKYFVGFQDVWKNTSRHILKTF